jgi:tetratricopeptide (TPR) repeat protein
VDRILEMEPNRADAHVLAAHAYADMNDLDAALAACQRALAINPLLPEARYILGLIYQREGDMVQAISEFKRTIYIDADFALAHMNLGTIYKAQQQWEMAARSYENAVHAQYKDPDGAWRRFLGGFQADLLVKTCERSLLECRKAMGIS